MSEPELCCEDLLNLLRVFEYSDEPEAVRAVFGRLCEFFALAARRSTDAVPCRDTSEAIPLAQYSALFTRVVALRMTGQDGNTEEPPLKPEQIVRPDVAFGWAKPRGRSAEPAFVRTERSIEMSMCVALHERTDADDGHRERAKKRVAQLFGCGIRRIEQALSECPTWYWANIATKDLQSTRKSIKSYRIRR